MNRIYFKLYCYVLLASVFEKYWVENGHNAWINDDSNLSIVRFKIGSRIMPGSPFTDPCQTYGSCVLNPDQTVENVVM